MSIVDNRKAYHDYFIEETCEAGLVLTGSEVKSLRVGKANLKDSHARIERGEAWLANAHISEYGPSAQFGPEPTRKRKLLLHAREIERLAGKIKENRKIWEEKIKNVESWADLPVPVRMEKMLAFSKEHIAREEENLEATKIFYATLSLEQRKIFDKEFNFEHHYRIDKHWKK